jgi:hypothetical protein
MLGFGKRNDSSQRSVDPADDTHDYASSEEAGLVNERKEKRFVRKLDWILVTWAFFAYLLKVGSGRASLFDRHAPLTYRCF